MAAQRRSYGTGSLYVRADGNGREQWYGRWWTNGRQLKRSIGPKRADGTRDGLTRAQAEAELRRLIAETPAAKTAAGEGLTVAELGRRYALHLEAQGRKKSTVTSVRSVQRIWLDPHLGDRAVGAVRVEDVEDLVRTMRSSGVGAKSVRNYIGTLGAMYRYAVHPRRGWASANPADAVELPPVEASTEIHWLTLEDVDALADAAVDGEHQALDRALYVTAALTGLRQGELIALRWQDVDWNAQRIRVRRNHVLGEYGTPKSKRSSRSVPMATRLAGELDRLHQVTAWQDDEDLVFPEPRSGEPLRRGALMRRYRRALKAALLDHDHRFHDLRHTFGTAMAAAGVPMRTLQEWMGHRDLQTTQRYADYAPNAHETAMVEDALSRGHVRGHNLSESQRTSEHPGPVDTGFGA